MVIQKNLPRHRTALQQLGDELDVSTDYRWVVNDVAEHAIGNDPNVRRWLFDSVRKPRQVEHFRIRYSASVFHVHLIASEQVLRTRYDARLVGGNDYAGDVPLRVAIDHPN